MWKKPGTPIPIHHSQLVVGLYIWLDISWIDHPFMTNRIMVETEKQISIIRAHNPDGHLFYYPEMSTAAQEQELSLFMILRIQLFQFSVPLLL